MIDNNCEKIGVQEMNYVSPPPPLPPYTVSLYLSEHYRIDVGVDP